MRARRVSLALTFGDVDPPAETVADTHDRDQLIKALQAAHARDHDLVQQLEHAARALAEGRAALERSNELLRTRTIERDHYAQDGHLWALCLAYLAKQEPDEQLELPSDDVNLMEGLMLSANVEGGLLYIVVNDRPHASEEGGGEGA